MTDFPTLPAGSFNRLRRVMTVLVLSLLGLEIAWLWQVGPIIPEEQMAIRSRASLPAPAVPPLQSPEPLRAPPPAELAAVTTEPAAEPITAAGTEPAPAPAPEPAVEVIPPVAPDVKKKTARPRSDMARLSRMLAAASTSGPVRPRNKLSAAAAPTPVAAMKSLDKFRDCEQCPLMVALPTGRFRMGSNDGNAWELPRHPVGIVQRYAMARFEITERQWQACVSDGYCAKNAGKSSGLPVTKVRWQDTQDYVAWLRDKTGRRYRLPSEAEWAYAIRGGSSASRFWGPDRQNQCLYANGADQSLKKASAAAAIAFVDCDDHYPRRAPVGSFRSNAYGLHDMAGNVWEWVQDCWSDNYQDAPADGSAVIRKGCNEFVIRGGSWRMRPEALRSAERGRALAGQRSDDLGFRVAAD